MDADRCWQAPFAAIGSMLPGASFLSIAAYGITVGTSANCLQFVTGRAIFAILLLVTVAAVMRATWITIARLRETAVICSASRAPSQRLREAQAKCAVREISDPHPFCAVLGILRPVIVVSSGTLERLDDEELRAALSHEAAHIERYDHVLGAVTAFFSDLLPFGTTDLLNAYWEAREFAADQRALAQTQAESLAGAIIALARPSSIGLAALGGGSVTERLRRLLAPPAQAVSFRGRVLAAGTLMIAAAIALLPIAAGTFGLLSCHAQ
jgi:Zn-dependent protease with chaperone function